MRFPAIVDGYFRPPIVVINTAHSGSGLLTRVLIEAGIYMGSNLSATMDCLDMVPLVEKAVMGARGGFPAGDELDDEETLSVARMGFARHLDGVGPDQRWGWKLCETLLIVPLIERYFPGAIFIHLIRDGRDVAFSPFASPKAPYWRKVYFGSDKVQTWRGFPITQRAYRVHGYLFNAARWRYHVDLAQAFGAELGPRYIEVRYEDLVERHDETRTALLAALGIAREASGPASRAIYSSSIGKWRRQPASKIQRVCDIVEPTLSSFGYLDIGPTSRRTANLLDRIFLGGII